MLVLGLTELGYSSIPSGRGQLILWITRVVLSFYCAVTRGNHDGELGIPQYCIIVV